ncbi:MAG: prepilin-type N-terminal cleavage/methylation domain-containing protein [Planctomycetota bacterium]
MRRRYGQSGMSLMELLVALAIILILISALIGTGSYVKTRADIDLTKGMLETLSTALEQYYDDTGGFPFDTATGVDTTPIDGKDDYLLGHLGTDLGGTVAPITALLEETDGAGTTVSTASSAALFYFLDKNPASRAIVGGIANSLVTNKDAAGTAITITIGTNPAIDLPRYIDPWKMSIRYEYLAGTAFPVLTSAGPDKIFDTPDDITSK